MIETYVDFATNEDIRLATDRANEVIKTAESAGWMMIQCQLLQTKDPEEDSVMNTYSIVFQRTKEVKIKQKFELGGEHAYKEPSAEEVSMGK